RFAVLRLGLELQDAFVVLVNFHAVAGLNFFEEPVGSFANRGIAMLAELFAARRIENAREHLARFKTVKQERQQFGLRHEAGENGFLQCWRERTPDFRTKQFGSGSRVSNLHEGLGAGRLERSRIARLNQLEQRWNGISGLELAEQGGGEDA